MCTKSVAMFSRWTSSPILLGAILCFLYQIKMLIIEVASAILATNIAFENSMDNLFGTTWISALPFLDQINWAPQMDCPARLLYCCHQGSDMILQLCFTCIESARDGAACTCLCSSLFSNCLTNLASSGPDTIHLSNTLGFFVRPIAPPSSLMSSNCIRIVVSFLLLHVEIESASSP